MENKAPGTTERPGGYATAGGASAHENFFHPRKKLNKSVQRAGLRYSRRVAVWFTAGITLFLVIPSYFGPLYVEYVSGKDWLERANKSIWTRRNEKDYDLYMTQRQNGWLEYLGLKHYNISGEENIVPPFMKIISDVYRQTFPKKLRFDKACLILHAELLMIARRHKHKKYIPKEEICDLLNQYEPLPGSPWLQLPVIRHVLLIRPINSVRVLLGWRSWLINRSVDEEFHRVKRWMTVQEGTGAKNFKAHRISGFVLRERFVAEVLDPFHVAGMYQRMMRWGLFVVIVLLLFIFASLNLDALVYFFLVRWCGMGRKEVLEWFRGITERHLVTEVPPAYKALLPPPCVLHMPSDGMERYETKILELVSPDENIVVMAIPCPQVGSKKFFSAVGKAASLCDAVMMEGVSFEYIDRIVPAAFLPLRDNTFPALGLHHRFIDVVRGKREPPFLYPTVSEMTWRVYWTQFFVPFEWRCVYSPTSFSASKGEARMCWGRLRELIETVSASQADAGEGGAEPYVICLPWTLHQIVNLEASLIKYGFRVGRVFSMEWMDRDYMGRHFCDYYGVAEG